MSSKLATTASIFAFGALMFLAGYAVTAAGPNGVWFWVIFGASLMFSGAAFLTGIFDSE